MLPLIASVAAASLVGCESALDRIDRDTRAAIREHAIASLGQDGDWHDSIVQTPTPYADAPSTSYDRTPPTTNPAASALPANPVATTAPTTQTSVTPYRNPTDTGVAPAEYDLPQALSYAFSRAPDYRNEREKLFLSAISLLVQRHLWGPRFFDTVTARVSKVDDGSDREQAFELINQLGVSQKLPYGGTVSATAVTSFLNRLRSSTDGTSGPDDQQSAQLLLSAVFPLLRGAGLAAQEDLIQAQRDLIYAVRTFENFRRAFLVKVSSGYYELLRGQSEIANRQLQVKNLEWLLRRTTALANAGRIANFEVQRSELQVLFAKSKLVDAQEKYNVLLDAFKINVGMPTRDPLRIKPTEVKLERPETPPEESMTAGLTYRLELQTLSDQVDDTRRRIDVAKNATLPGLDVNLQAGLGTDADKRYPGLKFNGNDGSYAAGVTFDAPLDRQVEELRVRSAMIENERARRTLQLTRDRVVLEVRQGMRTIEQARFTLEVQTRNIAIATKRIEGVTLRLRELGPRDFIEAQNDLLDALNLRDTALRDLRVSILNYLLATGQIRVTPAGQWRAPGKLVAIAPPVVDPAWEAKQSVDEVEATVDKAKNEVADEKPQEKQP